MNSPDETRRPSPTRFEPSDAELIVMLTEIDPLVQTSGADELRTWDVCGCCHVEHDITGGAFPHADDCVWALATKKLSAP